MKKSNREMAERVFWILLAGLPIQLLSLKILGPSLVFGGSFWSGVGIAVILAIYIYHAIDYALTLSEEEGEAFMRKAYQKMGGMIVLVAIIVCLINPQDLIAVFLGIICLKFGELLRRLYHWLKGKVS